jgi:hypothetical protein
MRKKMLLLSVAAAALIGALTAPPSSATGGVCEPICTYYSDGSQCCVPCWGKWPNCGCTNLYCPPEDGGN